ncbi:PorT family protein [Bacteroidia bacterium]|nr:PorT family protein [Bacteroidia bacterium]MDB9883239.1 PorT family protein [Bacteroidia bacterium]
MKKILLIFFSLYSCLFALGQGFGAQVHLAANFSQVDGDQLGGYNKLGLNAGLQINRAIKEDWEGAFEIRYSMKGAKKVIDPEAPATFSLKLNYDYLEVPFLLKYTKYDKITPFAGISVGANVRNQRDENGIVSNEQALNFMEVGFHLGGNYHFTDKWGIDLRHSYSLISVRDFPIVVNSPTWFGRAGWYNRLFSVGLTYTP